MARGKEPYPVEFRQMVKLVRSGRTPEALSREFGPSGCAVSSAGRTQRAIRSCLFDRLHAQVVVVDRFTAMEGPQSEDRRVFHRHVETFHRESRNGFSGSRPMASAGARCAVSDRLSRPARHRPPGTHTQWLRRRFLAPLEGRRPTVLASRRPWWIICNAHRTGRRSRTCDRGSLAALHVSWGERARRSGCQFLRHGG
jgi:hypothetical protein